MDRLLVKMGKEPTPPSPTGYTEIYSNESYSYFISNNIWDKYLKTLDIVSIKDLDLQGSARNILIRVIPKYGKELYILLALVAREITTVIHTIEDVLDIMITDNQLIIDSVNVLESMIRESNLYSKFENRLASFAAEQKNLKDRISELEQENQILKKQLSSVRSTGDWVYETKLPVLKNCRELNNCFQKDRVETKKIILKGNSQINIPKDLDTEYQEFLTRNYHYIIEFIAIKFTKLIPYIMRYLHLKKEDHK